MNEALRNVAVLVYALCAINTNAYAQTNEMTIAEEAPQAVDPVIVYGASSTAPGKKDEVLLEQRSGDENPLGNPIVDDTAAAADDEKYVIIPGGHEVKAKPAAVTQNSPQNPPIGKENSPEKVNDEIQNTLYESGGRIYDVQSYPDDDIRKIEQPNIPQAITNYPAY